MIDSRTRGLAFGALLAAAVAPPWAVAQDEEAVGPPVQLIDPAGEGVSVEPAPAPQSAEPEPMTATEGEIAQEAVEVQPLTVPDQPWVGLLDENRGGFGIDMWRSTSLALLERVLPSLPMGTPSPAMQDLARRLLLSDARAPAGEGLGSNLLAIRIERLIAGGETEAANQLIALAAARAPDPALARAEVDGFLLAGDNAGACARISDAVRGNSDPYWLKGLTFCRALRAERATARLAVDLLRELGETGDEAFFVLVRALNGDPAARIESLTEATPLHLAMMRAANMEIPADAVAGAPPAVVRAIAAAPNASDEVRLDAAERAAAAGILPVERVAQIYGGFVFEADAVENAIEIARYAEGAWANALLYRLGRERNDAAGQAEVAQASMRRARARGGFVTAARIYAPTIRELEPGAALDFAIAELVPAMLAAGDSEAAAAWYARAEGAVATALWPLMQIARGPVAMPLADEAPRVWLQARADLPEAERYAAAALVFTLLEALGHEIAADDWETLFEGQLRVPTTMPAPALWRGLGAAAAAGAVGETVLMVLLVLGEPGPAGANATTLGAVVEALGAVGLEDEARAIALEAVLAALG